MRGFLTSSLDTSTHYGTAWKDAGKTPRSRQREFFDWLTITDEAKSVATDVERIRTHPLVPKTIPIYGFLYQVETGKLVEIPEATAIGSATKAT